MAERDLPCPSCGYHFGHKEQCANRPTPSGKQQHVQIPRGLPVSAEILYQEFVAHLAEYLYEATGYLDRENAEITAKHCILRWFPPSLMRVVVQDEVRYHDQQILKHLEDLIGMLSGTVNRDVIEQMEYTVQMLKRSRQPVLPQPQPSQPPKSLVNIPPWDF